MCVCMWVRVYMHMHKEIRGQPWVLVSFLFATAYTRLAGLQASGDSHLHFPSHPSSSKIKEGCVLQVLLTGGKSTLHHLPSPERLLQLFQLPSGL